MDKNETCYTPINAASIEAFFSAINVVVVACPADAAASALSASVLARFASESAFPADVLAGKVRGPAQGLAVITLLR